jgi:hypothetical protein
MSKEKIWPGANASSAEYRYVLPTRNVAGLCIVQVEAAVVTTAGTVLLPVQVIKQLYGAVAVKVVGPAAINPAVVRGAFEPEAIVLLTLLVILAERARPTAIFPN